MKTIFNSSTSALKGSAKILSALALAAAIQFSPSKLAAEMGLRQDSSIPGSFGSAPIGSSQSSRGQIGRAPVQSQPVGEGRRDTTRERDDARQAVRQIESEARELYNTASRSIRNGSRDEITALNRVSNLQRSAYELTVTLDRRDCSPEMASRQYSAFLASYEAARNSWRYLCNYGGVRDYTVRIERCYSPVNVYFVPPVVVISWRDVRNAADDIEDAAEHIYETAVRESREDCDRRTSESRRAALSHLLALREAAHEFDDHSVRCGNDPVHSREDYRRLVRALDCARGVVRAFGRHAQRDFAELELQVYEIEPFYAVRRGHDHDHGHHGGWGNSWDRRGSEIGSVRVIGSVR